MKSSCRNLLHDDEGKGIAGCLLFIVLFSIAVYISIEMVPTYYSFYSIQSEIKREVSKAGARSLRDEDVVRDILNIAKRNNVPIAEDDITIDRVAGQIIIDVEYSVPTNFIVFSRDLNFHIRETSFIGSI